MRYGQPVRYITMSIFFIKTVSHTSTNCWLVQILSNLHRSIAFIWSNRSKGQSPDHWGPYQIVTLIYIVAASFTGFDDIWASSGLRHRWVPPLRILMNSNRVSSTTLSRCAPTPCINMIVCSLLQPTNHKQKCQGVLSDIQVTEQWAYNHVDTRGWCASR